MYMFQIANLSENGKSRMKCVDRYKCERQRREPKIFGYAN